MKLDVVVLGLLGQRPFSGYELGRWMEREGRFIRNQVHLSQVYRLLAKLTDEGLIEFTVVEASGRPDSKVYRLTPAGEKTLRDWAAGPYIPSTRHQDPEFGIRFMLGGAVDPESLVGVVRTELEARREQVRTGRTRDRRIGPTDPIEGVNPELFTWLNDRGHEVGARSIDVWIEWLTEILAELEFGETFQDLKRSPGSADL
ncbi:PadR family transcriptional regulator [Kribbella sp. CA-245084]|uniref:PadR family transcriptional regulator n=1 Tax=Kribbella sp. CA-245084 TaxID=3239940 RepID=UPI003D8DEB52